MLSVISMEGDARVEDLFTPEGIATMTDVLRADSSSIGMVTANGGTVEKHSFGIYSTDPPRSGGFRSARPQDHIDAAAPRVSVAEQYRGSAVIESYTVMHDRDGTASRAHATVRTPDGSRAWALTDDPAAMTVMINDDLVGLPVDVGADTSLKL